MTLLGPEQIDTTANIGTGSFYWQRPNVFLVSQTRFAFLTDTAGSGNQTWRIKAYQRNNGAKTWAELDAGNGPLVQKLGAAGGLTTVGGSGYVAASGVLDVASTTGVPAFTGTTPFHVVLGNPNGVILATLNVTGVNSPTQFAVTAIADGNAPAGTEVVQVTSTQGNPLNSPFGCPSFLQLPSDPTKIVIAYPDSIS